MANRSDVPANRFASCLTAAACAFVLIACTTEKLSMGEGCELNSECDAPLVCRLGKCRVDCVTNRDCAAGLNCVYDENRLGACQLPEDMSCQLTSDCSRPLVCQMATCTNVCAADRDCAPGAMCVPAPDGGTACFQPAAVSCVYATDCPDGMGVVCSSDQRCRPECDAESGYNCRYGTVCEERTLVGGESFYVCVLPDTTGVP